MKMTYERVKKSEMRNFINMTLFSACIGALTFILAVRPELLARSVFLSTQISLAIPFLLSTLFARARYAFAVRTDLWGSFGFATFLIGYAFIVNSFGIMLSDFVGAHIGVLFFVTNIVLAVAYSVLEVIEHPDEVRSRFVKDFFFALIVFVGGILPVIGYW